MTRPVPPGLFDYSNQLAAETWWKLERASVSPVRFSETSITDHNLLMLDFHFPQIRVFHFAAADEVRTGADWEWVIGSATLGWVTLRVQAKRAYPRVRSASYPELGHSRVDQGQTRYQYEDLIDDCDPTQGQFPLYVFYNGWGAPRPFGPTRWPPSTLELWFPALRSWFGCTVASATDVADAAQVRYGGKSVRAHVNHSLPWSSLWLPPRRPASANPSRSGLLETLWWLFWLGHELDPDDVLSPWTLAIRQQMQVGTPESPWWRGAPLWADMAEGLLARGVPVNDIVGAIGAERLRPRARIGVITNLDDLDVQDVSGRDGGG